MLGIGIGEMILIAGIALIVIGPEKFPDFAKIVLRTTRDLRGYVDDIQTEISKELKPVKRELDQIRKYDPEKYIDSLSKSATPASTAASASAVPATAADPTDRQDDSFDYGDGYKHPDMEFNAGQAASLEDVVPPDEAAPAPELRNSEAEPENDTPSVESEDEFDFSQAPVERLD